MSGLPHEDLVAVPPLPKDGAAPPAASPLISLGKIAWSLALSVLVLAVVGYLTFEPASFHDLLGAFNGGLLALAFATVALRILLGGWRLSYVSRGRLDLMGGIRGQLAWDFFSNVTPSAVGGGPVAALYIARDRNIPLGEATALMLFSMLLDQLWFALMIPLLLFAMPHLEIFPEALGDVGKWAFLAVFAGMLFWVALFGYAMLFRPELFQRVIDRIFRMRWLRRFRQRVTREMGQLRRRAAILRAQPARFYVNGFLLTAAGWMTRFVLPLLIVLSVYPEADKLLLLLRTVAMSIGTVILPTPGGSGGVEGLYALFLGPLMPMALVAPTLLTWRVLGYYLFLGLGVYLSMYHVRKTMRRRRQAAPALPSADARRLRAAASEETQAR